MRTPALGEEKVPDIGAETLAAHGKNHVHTTSCEGTPVWSKWMFRMELYPMVYLCQTKGELKEGKSSEEKLLTNGHVQHAPEQLGASRGAQS